MKSSAIIFNSQETDLLHASEIEENDTLYLDDDEEAADYYLEEASCRNRNGKNRSKAIKVSSKKSKHKKQIEAEKQLKLKQEIRHCIDKIIKTVKEGDIPRFTRLFDQYIELTGTKSDERVALLNKPVDDNGNTLLHIAAENKQEEFVSLLIVENADASVTNSKGLTPYQSTNDIAIKRVFFELTYNMRKTYPNPTHIPTDYALFEKSTTPNKPTKEYQLKFIPPYEPGIKHKLLMSRLLYSKIKPPERFPMCNACKSRIPRQQQMPLFKVYCSADCMNIGVTKYEWLRACEKAEKDFKRKHNLYGYHWSHIL